MSQKFEKYDRSLDRRSRESERIQKRSCLIARILFNLALLLVVLFLTPFATSTALQSEKGTQIKATEATYQHPAQLLSEEAPEDYENMYIEQALCEQGYYRDAVPLPYDLQDVMQSACMTYGVPYSLALAVCETESSFRPDVWNGNCYGYMQVNRCNFDWTGAETNYDPESPDGNIVCGVFILGDLLDRYDTTAALMCYNAGETGAARLWKEGVVETEYTRTVLDRADAWQTVLEN